MKIQSVIKMCMESSNVLTLLLGKRGPLNSWKGAHSVLKRLFFLEQTLVQWNPSIAKLLYNELHHVGLSLTENDAPCLDRESCSI